jgi:hypothetical protein
MGVSSTAIFGDDTACDVRDAYRRLVGDGSSGPQATNQLLRDWRETIADEDDCPVFWLALAATQWACGQLEKRVKTKALRIIDNGSSLGLWSEGGDSKVLKRRQGVLAKLRAELQAPQPAVKKIRKLPTNECPWTVGEVLAYRLRSGKLVLLHVVEEFGPSPVFAVFDWVGKEVPPAERIKELRLKRDPGMPFIYRVAVMRLNKKDFPADRIIQLALHRKPHRQRGIICMYDAIVWKELDAEFRSRFGLK